MTVALPVQNVPHVLRVRCHYCSRQQPAWNVQRIGPDAKPAQTICMECFEWHNKALDLLAGTGRPGCQVCLATWEYLRDSQVGEQVRMWVVPKDGIYQLLCAACINPYLEKRADLYRGTPFGTHALKI